MTERDNALLAIRHQKPQWVPNFYDAYQPFASSLMNDQGVFGKGGRDLFGTLWLVTQDTGYSAIPSPYEHVIDDITKWREKLSFPNLEKMNWKEAAKRDLSHVKRGEKLLAWFSMTGNFNRLEALMGIEGAFIAMYEEPDAVMDFFDAYTNFKLKQIELYAEYYQPDIYVNGDDVASSDGMFFSPTLYRSMFHPFEKKLAQEAIRHGMIVDHHVCGKVDDIIPDIIDTGATIWQTAQCMNDLVGIQEKYGDRLCIHGGWDSNGKCTMTDATEEDIRSEVRRCIDTYGKNGNYMLFPILMGDDNDPHIQMKRNWCRDECLNYSKRVYAEAAKNA